MRNVEAEEREAKRHRRIGEFIDSLGEGQGLGSLEGGILRGWKVRLPTEEDPGALLIVQAENEVGAFVAFVGGYRVGDVILAWRKRGQSGRMKWREDRPWDGVSRG